MAERELMDPKEAYRRATWHLTDAASIAEYNAWAGVWSHGWMASRLGMWLWWYERDLHGERWDVVPKWMGVSGG